MCDAPDQKQAWKRVNRLIGEWSVTYPDLAAWLEETIAHAGQCLSGLPFRPFRVRLHFASERS